MYTKQPLLLIHSNNVTGNETDLSEMEDSRNSENDGCGCHRRKRRRRRFCCCRRRREMGRERHREHCDEDEE
ncbi:hypothetical protein [Aneurinibacillus tyrosinisolvens]|uniref:hypothetical protein n=1 Tax=Aneurinibacillus tyrosinisolvens TaxID=1443435 RepID=UPI000AA6A958|nr:hypothetical protein [Aneurinibacillus tyrosinisolvens]